MWRAGCSTMCSRGIATGMHASAVYASTVERHRARVGSFTRLQHFVRHVPNAAFAPLAWVIARRAVRSWGLTRYMNWEHDPFPRRRDAHRGAAEHIPEDATDRECNRVYGHRPDL